MGHWTRRAFLAGTTATAGVVALAAVGCSGDDDDDERSGGKDDDGDEPTPVEGLEVSADGVPTQAAIFGLISEVFEHGVRRPGYEADIWCEEWIAEHYRALGLENVRLEPVKVRRWEPTDWKLEAIPEGGEAKELTCFPVPFAEPVENLEIELVAYDKNNPGVVQDKASLYDVDILRVPADLFVPADREGRLIDPDDTLGETHILPFGGELQEVVDPSVAAGAAAFIGTLQGYPTDTCEYFVPYHGRTVEIPGVWINGSDGRWLHEQLAAGPVRIKLSVATTDAEFESHNVVGELPGADDDMVIIGSHHDGPWSSAVEDGSGISLVLAQATYWAAKPQAERPHRLVFLLQGGHMSGGAGLLTFIEEHRDELANVVLEVHLEHAALDSEDRDGELVSLDRPVPRWVFTSEIPRLKEAVFEAFTAEDLRRSMILPTNAIGDQPPTDGAFYPVEGVPVVQVLAAPWYLFDSQDTLDKVHQESLVPLTKATIRIIDSTKGVSAAQMRET